jgi:hypothetical protein
MGSPVYGACGQACLLHGWSGRNESLCHDSLESNDDRNKKYAKADLGSLYLTNVSSINDKTWKGDIVPYWKDVAANATPLKNAARLLAGDGTLQHTEKVQAQNVVDEMEKLMAKYFETYFSEAKGVKNKTKFNVESVTSNIALEQAVKDIIDRKFLGRIWKPLE